MEREGAEGDTQRSRFISRKNCFKNFHKWLIKFDVALERDERTSDERSNGRAICLLFLLLLLYVYVCFVVNFGSVCFIDCSHTIHTQGGRERGTHAQVNTRM